MSEFSKNFAVYSSLVLMMSSTAIAGPLGEAVVAGDIEITRPDDTTTIIDQTTQKGVIDFYGGYNVGENESVIYRLPDAKSATLNRDFSGNPSLIFGSIQSNGKVYITNRNGILFGQNAQIDVSGLVASTADISTENFLFGNLRFDIPGNANAMVENRGNITIHDAGIAAFVAPSVRNSGHIVANLGKIELSSASAFTLDPYGDRLISFLVSDPSLITGEGSNALVDNTGTIRADGGQVVMSASQFRGVVNNVINHDGIVEANTVGERNGKIVFGAGNGNTASTGVTRVTGTVKARGDDAGETGGEIYVLGEKVGLFEQASLDASGFSGGGNIFVGGDYLGQGSVPTAQFTFASQDSSVRADALSTGNGGRVILWSDIATNAFGTVTARGGNQSGDGGFIEVSGKESLSFFGLQADASASNGRAGEVLFDPGDIYIVGSQAEADNSGNIDLSNPFVANGPTKIWNYAISDYLSAGNNVTLKGLETGQGSSGNIYVNADILKLDGNHSDDVTLSLFAADRVTFADGVTVESRVGKLNLYIDADYDRHGVGVITLPSTASIYTNGGFTNFNGSQINTLGTIDTTVRFTGDGNSDSSVAGLQRSAHDFFEHTDFAFLKVVAPKESSEDISIVDAPELPEEEQAVSSDLAKEFAIKFGIDQTKAELINSYISLAIQYAPKEDLAKIFGRDSHILFGSDFLQKAAGSSAFRGAYEKTYRTWASKITVGKVGKGVASAFALAVIQEYLKTEARALFPGQPFKAAAAEYVIDQAAIGASVAMSTSGHPAHTLFLLTVEETIYTVDKVIEVVKVHNELQDSWEVANQSFASWMDVTTNVNIKASLLESTNPARAAEMRALYEDSKSDIADQLDDSFGLSDMDSIVSDLMDAKYIAITTGDTERAKNLVNRARSQARTLEGWIDNIDILDNNDYDKVTDSIISGMGLDFL